MKTYKDLYEAVEAANGTLLFRKGTIRKTESQLHDNEQIFFAGLATFKTNLIGVLVITQHRVFGHAASLGDFYFQEIPINKVRKINYSTIGKKLNIYGDVCTIDSEVVNRSTLKIIAQTINELKSSQSNEKNIEEEKNINVKQLKDLKELLDMGIISSDEFEAKKKQILNL